MKKFSASLIVKKMKIKIMSYSFLLITLLKILCLTIWCLELFGEVVLPYCTDESEHWYTHFEKTVWYNLLYLWMNLPYKPEVLFLDICSRGQNYLCCCYLVIKSCPTLLQPMDCSSPGSSVHGILQARILAWVPFPSPGDLSHAGIEPESPALQADYLPLSYQGSPVSFVICSKTQKTTRKSNDNEIAK